MTDRNKIISGKNAIVTEAFMAMVEKARRFDEIENAIANGKGLKYIKRMIEG